MAKNSSFDIVSQIDMQELDNALNQTRKEIEQRYDFRGSNATIELADGDLKLAAEDEYKLGAILDILRQRMAKRGLSLRALEPGKVEPAAKGTVRQTVKLKQGIDKETAKKIIAAIKASKIKVPIPESKPCFRVLPVYETPSGYRRAILAATMCTTCDVGEVTMRV